MRYPQRETILATRSDIEKAKSTIERLRRENARLKMQAYLAKSHIDGLRREVADLRRRLRLPLPADKHTS